MNPQQQRITLLQLLCGFVASNIAVGRCPRYIEGSAYISSEGNLLFDNQEQLDPGERVSMRRLAAQLGRIRLIVIYAYQSTTVNNWESQGGSLTGAPALSLVSEAIVALQITIRINTATRFSEVLYEELARGRSLRQQSLMHAYLCM